MDPSCQKYLWKSICAIFTPCKNVPSCIFNITSVSCANWLLTIIFTDFVIYINAYKIFSHHHRKAVGDGLRFQLPARSLHVHGTLPPSGWKRSEGVARVPTGLPQGQVARVQGGVPGRWGVRLHWWLWGHCGGWESCFVWNWNYLIVKWIICVYSQI